MNNTPVYYNISFYLLSCILQNHNGNSKTKLEEIYLEATIPTTSKDAQLPIRTNQFNFQFMLHSEGGGVISSLNPYQRLIMQSPQVTLFLSLLVWRIKLFLP